MKTNQSKSLIIYLLVGFMYCFITKNIISISFGSYGGDPFYIISNPSIDKEFWYISLLSFVLTIKLCFNSSHAQVVTILKSYKRINSLFEIYAQYRQRKTFMIFINIWSDIEREVATSISIEPPPSKLKGCVHLHLNRKEVATSIEIEGRWPPPSK